MGRKEGRKEGLGGEKYCKVEGEGAGTVREQVRYGKKEGWVERRERRKERIGRNETMREYS